MTVAASFIRGKPIMQTYDPGATVLHAGDVVVIGDLPCVVHEDDPAFTGAGTLDAVAVGGGIYAMTADASIPLGTSVYWDPTQLKVTESAATGTVHFGVIVGGANDKLSDAAATTCSVLHAPAAGGAGSTIYSLGATANDNISNTASETAFATTATIPAGSLQAGDIVHIRTVVNVLAQNSTNTNNVKLKIATSGGNTYTAIITSGAANLAANGMVYIDVDCVFTAVGTAGSFYANGIQLTNIATGTTALPVVLGATAINTNEAVIIEVTDTQSAGSVGNNAQLQMLNVSRQRR